MKTTRAALLAFVLAAACGGNKNQPAENPPAEPPPPSSGGEDTSGGRSSPGPVTAAPDGGIYEFEACVKECVRNHQAQAIPVEQIEANCQGECAAQK
jgi:hypothetical protein